MRKLSYFIASFLIVPAIAFAAYNDVTLTTSAVINVGGFNLSVSGSSAVVQSITVSAGSFNVVLLPGSSFAVSSVDKKDFTTSVSGGTTTAAVTCNTSNSVLTLTPQTGTATVTVTPTGTCATPSGAGGGWGGPVAGTVVTPAPASALTISPGQGGQLVRNTADGSSVVLIVPANAIASSTSFIIAELNSGYTLPDSLTGLGMAGSVVYQITGTSNGQAVTNFSKPVTLVFHYLASSFAESTLKIYFFNIVTRTWQILDNNVVDTIAHTVTANTNHLTQFALFGSGYAVQTPTTATALPSSSKPILVRSSNDTKVYIIINNKKHWIKTVNEFNAGGYDWSKVAIVSPATIMTYSDADTTAAFITKKLRMGMKDSQVILLQEILMKEGDLSPDLPKGYFGQLTKKALQKFQVRNGIKGVGWIGPQTMAKLNGLMK